MSLVSVLQAEQDNFKDKVQHISISMCVQLDRKNESEHMNPRTSCKLVCDKY